ncbi:MAG: hypothetical protein U0183_10630 [Polyangiaceae bacterium]
MSTHSRSKGSFYASLSVSCAALVALLPAACSDKEIPKSTYFERTIAPVLSTSCVRANTGAGCHVADDRGNALGNLDVASYAQLVKRRDLLLDYGPYGQPAFLVKNVEPFQVRLQSYDGKVTTVTTDIKHAGGSIFDGTSSGYQTLRRWIQNGASENNAGPPKTNVEKRPCNPEVPAGPDVTKDPATPDFALFKDKVGPTLKEGCAAGNCHGTPSNTLYLTCNDTPEQVRWNYYAARDYLAQRPEDSELLRRPLAPAQGGAFHEGGVVYDSPDAAGYASIREWAIAHGPPKPPTDDPAFAFFAQRVQPMFVKKGCMMVQCHSAAMFHDFRLRGGSGGSFSLSATRKNYELSLHQIAPEGEDPAASRLIRKNLYRAEACSGNGCDRASGILHRGGPLLEDFRNDVALPERCQATPAYDYDNGDLDKIPAYCVMIEWIRREREVSKPTPFSAIVYVRRPLAQVPGKTQDFDVYQPGADLRRIAVTTAANGTITPGADGSLSQGCGLDPATADVRRPAVSWDGKKVAFAARSSATEPFAIYEMNADGTACAKHPEINAGPPSQNGILIHNFDPAYAPPEGGRSQLVFASTRGNLPNPSFDYQGPQRTPSDPSKPNSNLYVFERDGAGTRIRQLTYLLNMEREPSFMADGRLIFTTEKRAPGFYQLALRRINMDGADYHPLFSQRGSVGYSQSTRVVELPQKDLVAVFSEPGVPFGGGTLGVVNRSIGIDFQSANAADYPVDPSVIDPASRTSVDPQFFLRSLRFVDGTVSGRRGQPTAGLYTTPAALPNGQILASFGAAADTASFNGDYDVVVVDPNRGGRQKLFGEAGTAEIDAVAVYGKVSRGVFKSTTDEANANTRILPGKSEADITVLSMPVLASLLFQNTPTGRPLENDAKEFEVYEDLPPPLEIASHDAAGAQSVQDPFGKVFVRRRSLGKVPIEGDGSAHFQIPGGVPIVLRLPDTQLSGERKWPRYQREQMSFAPGEYSNQSFRAELFDGLCAACHGSVSGLAIDSAVRPDVLTQASQVVAKGSSPANLNRPPNERGKIEGAPPSP